MEAQRQSARQGHMNKHERKTGTNSRSSGISNAWSTGAAAETVEAVAKGRSSQWQPYQDQLQQQVAKMHGRSDKVKRVCLFSRVKDRRPHCGASGGTWCVRRAACSPTAMRFEAVMMTSECGVLRAPPTPEPIVVSVELPVTTAHVGTSRGTVSCCRRWAFQLRRTGRFPMRGQFRGRWADGVEGTENRKCLSCTAVTKW